MLAPNKPKLFISLDGPILVPPTDTMDRDDYLGAAIAPYSKAFVHWATKHFDVRWLSDKGLGPATYVATKLGLPQDAVRVSGFNDSKVEAVSKYKDFYWVDSELIPHEVSWLAQHGHVDRLISVDPLKGVSTDDKKALEAHVVKTHVR